MLGMIFLNDGLRGAETGAAPLDENGKGSGLGRCTGVGVGGAREGGSVDGGLADGGTWLPAGFKEEIVAYALGYGERIKG